MIFKLENSEVLIDGKSIFKTFVLTYVAIEACRAIYRAEKRCRIKLAEELRRMRKEQKLTKKNEKRKKKKQKIESK